MGVLQVEKKNIPKLAWNLHRYRPDIDGLRAVAVIFVIIFHLDPTWIKGAFVGVDIFFVISGFVVSMSMLKPRDKNGEMRTPCEFFCIKLLILGDLILISQIYDSGQSLSCSSG
jgi:hypothetical protein